MADEAVVKSPDKPLGHFIASLSSRYREFGISFDTHYFVLGNDWEFTRSLDSIWEDIAEDIRARNRIPMPFPDISCISYLPREGNPDTGESTSPVSLWMCDHVREIQVGQVREFAPHQVVTDEELEGVSQAFAITRIYDSIGIPIPWLAGFCGITPEGKLLLKCEPRLGRDTSVILRQIAAISHPMNYIVRVEPELTPHEARRVAAGKSFPAAKTPHYIVVDHEVLVDLRRGVGGTHAPPILHERRGHWRRLGERCRVARAQGRERTWVRPAWVGEESFTVGRNRYCVMNLKKGVENG